MVTNVLNILTYSYAQSIIMGWLLYVQYAPFQLLNQLPDFDVTASAIPEATLALYV
jgi:hypothetical protein